MNNEKIIEPGKWFAEFDHNGNYIRVVHDKSYRDILGYDSDVGNTTEIWVASIHPDDRKRVLEYIQTSKESNKEGVEYDIEYRMMTKWGYRWFHDYAHCTRSKSGVPERWDGVIFDINDAKTMNSNMGSMQLSLDVLKQSKIGLWAVELDEGCEPRMYGDEAMLELVGINGPATPEEVFHAWNDNIDKEHYADVHEGIGKMLEGIHSEVQYPWHYPNGRTIIVRCGGIRNPKYTKGIRLEGVHRDITNLIHYEKELQEKFLDSQKIIQSFTSTYNFACVANLSNNTFTVLRMDERMIGYGKTFDTFSRALDFFISDVVFAPDKEKMRHEVDFKIIRQKLEADSTYSVYYRTLVNRVTIWHEMNVKKLDKELIAIGFAPKNQEILLQKIQGRLNEDYYALFSIDLDTELITVLKNAPWYTLVKEGLSIELGKALSFFLKDVAGETKIFFQQFINKAQISDIFTKEEKRSFTYLSTILNKWINVSVYVVFKHDDGTPATLSMGFSFVDSFESEKQKLQKLLKENMEIIGGFTSEYIALYYMNLQDNTFKIYSLGDKLLSVTKQLFTESSDPFELLHKFANTPDIHPDDRKLFAGITKEKTKEILRNKKKYSILFRRDYGQGYKWFVMDAVKSEKENEEPVAITIGFAECDTEIRRQQAQINSLAILREDNAPDNAINEQLSLLGDFYEAERTYILEFTKSKTFVQCTYEWCDTGIHAIKDNLQELPSEKFDFWIKNFEEHRSAITVTTKDATQLSKEQVAYLVNRGINSVIIAPLMKGNELKGFIGVVNPNPAINSTDPLQTAASIAFSEILRRKENDEEHVTLSKLTEAFLSVYYVDLTTDYMRTWKIDNIYKNDFGSTKKYSESMGQYVQSFIAERERERCVKMTSPAYILEQFKTKDQFSIEMTDTYTGKEVNIVFDYIKVSEDGNQFVICSKDVTESLSKQKEQQENLEKALSEAQQANSQITHQKRLLDYFMQSYTSAYSLDLTNETFEILHINHEFSDQIHLGTTRESINKFIFEHIHVDDRELMYHIINKDYLTSKLQTEKFFSFTIREVFGSIVKSMRGIVVRGIDEYHVAVGFMDITDELRKDREQQERLQEALSMAQSANRAKTTFLNNMSHDIRTPMNAIIGYTGLASAHIDNKEKVRDYLGKINQSSSHLLSLINDVLDMSRIESGKMNLEEKKENLEDIILVLKNIVQTDIQNNQQKFHVDFVNIENKDIICDKLRLTQILLNILSNAIKYTGKEGTISMKIEQINRENDFATFEFCIQDNGMGMSKEFLKTIYEPFTRVKSSTVSGIQGTGLGMSIAKNIVDMMGGNIRIQSEIGKGTKVNITFDFKICDPLKKENTAEIEYEFTGKKILLVEDNAFNREIATELLEDYGFNVSTAADGNIAVDIIRHAQSGDFDIILMDIQMPTIDGYEATKLIRALGTELSKIPIIAMTANAFEEDRQKALMVGMNEHIAKPINLQELKSTIAKILFKYES